MTLAMMPGNCNTRVYLQISVPILPKANQMLSKLTNGWQHFEDGAKPKKELVEVGDRLRIVSALKTLKRASRKAERNMIIEEMDFAYPGSVFV